MPHRSIAHVNFGPELFGDTQPRIDTHVPVDGPCARKAALPFLRKRPKMAR